MLERYPIHVLIENQRKKLGMPRSELIRQCGFKNVTKGLRRLDALCDGDLASPGARMILDALPTALEVEASEVEKTVKETADIITRTKAEEEAEREASWRASFEPSAYLVGMESRPSSISIYGLSGGAERWLRIPLDLSQPPVTYTGQALAVVRRTPTVPFFGATKGFIISYTPDHAVQFNTDGNVVASFEKAYRPGEVEFSSASTGSREHGCLPEALPEQEFTTCNTVAGLEERHPKHSANLTVTRLYKFSQRHRWDYALTVRWGSVFLLLFIGVNCREDWYGLTRPVALVAGTPLPLNVWILGTRSSLGSKSM